MQELFDRAAELANKEDQLSEALAKEAEQAAKQLNPQQQKQQDLQRQAENLAADQELQQDKKVAKPVDLKAFEDALAEMKNGNAEQAAEAQRKAAEDLEKLAEALERNANLPADPQAAAKELANRERALKDQLQQLAQKEREAHDARQQAEQQKKELTAEQKQNEEALAEQRRDQALEQAALQTAAAQLDVPRHAKDPQKDAIRQAQESVQNLLKDQKPNQRPETAQRAMENADRPRMTWSDSPSKLGLPKSAAAGTE